MLPPPMVRPTPAEGRFSADDYHRTALATRIISVIPATGAHWRGYWATIDKVVLAWTAGDYTTAQAACDAAALCFSRALRQAPSGPGRRHRYGRED